MPQLILHYTLDISISCHNVTYLFPFSLILLQTFDVVVREVRTIVPKSTIPNYSNEVRGEISYDFGIGNTCLALLGC